MIRFTMVAAVLLAAAGASVARGQDADEVAKLKREVELLKKENVLLAKEAELLKKEVELLKKEAKAAPESSDTDKGKTGANLKTMLNDVEYELLQCVRDPKKRTRVMFTFGLKSEMALPLYCAPHQLSLTDGDGAAIDVKVVKGPPLKGDFLGIERAALNLPKGKVIKFQIIVEGVKEGVTSIDRVELTEPARGLVARTVTFTSVKVASKK